MNRQDIWRDGKLVKIGIGWTCVWGRPGYTANPVRGCVHGCRWTMPDGHVAQCYAEALAEQMRYSTPIWRGGFQKLTFDESELEAIRSLKSPCGIFLGSMADLVGKDVPAEWIEKTIAAIRECPQHVFFVLTKNAPRLTEFRWPQNAWIGVSVPPSFMFGDRLSDFQQLRMLQRAFKALRQVEVPVRWLSAEPLSFDISEHLGDAPLSWVVIGAASRGKVTYQPQSAWVTGALKVLDRRQIPVYFKENLTWSPRRVEFPPETVERLPTQAALF